VSAIVVFTDAHTRVEVGADYWTFAHEATSWLLVRDYAPTERAGRYLSADRLTIAEVYATSEVLDDYVEVPDDLETINDHKYIGDNVAGDQD
jgi:hypothetical protein